MKILLVRNTPVAPDPPVNKIAKFLTDKGNEVVVLAWDRECNYPKKEFLNGYTIIRFRLKAPYGKPIIAIFIPLWILYQFSFYLSNKFDVIHAFDFDTFLPSILISRIKKVKTVYHILDFYSELFPKQFPKIISKIIKKIDVFFMNFANYVILVDPCRLKQIGNYELKNVMYIYNTPPDTSIKIEPKRDENRKKFTIFYGGQLELERGLTYMIDAVNEMDGVELILAGHGKDANIIIEKIRKSKHSKYIGKISYDEVLENSLRSDVLFAFYDTIIPNNKYASPNKLFEAMMCGKPIIVNENTCMAETVKREKCGILIPFGNIKQIKIAILTLKNSHERSILMGLNGRNAYEERYSWRIMENSLNNIYIELQN